MASNWCKKHCDVCNKETWWTTSPGATSSHCTDHSNWTPNRKHAVVGAIMQARLSPVHEAPSERELRIANRLDRSLWKHAEQRNACSVYIGDQEWAKDLFPVDPAPVTLNPDKVYCTFCGKETDKINTLSEKKAFIRKVIETYRTGDGEIVMREKVTTRTETLHACPEHCLEIRKPIVVRRV